MKKLARQFASSATLFALTAAPAFAQYSLPNPLGSADPEDIIANIISGILGIVGLVALVFVIYGGFMWLTSAGNPERVKKGRDTLLWAALGIIVVFASYGITQALFQAIAGETPS